jgi:hypothetical protein
LANALRFASTGSLLTFSAATLVAAALTLKNARRYVDLAEARMGCLREEQARLLEFVREEHQMLKEEAKRERKQRLEAQQETERLSREFVQLRQTQEQLAEELERERAKYLEDRQQARQQARQEREQRERERRNAERKIDQLKRELQELREIQQSREAQQKREIQELREIQQDRMIRRVSSPPVPAGLPENLSENREHPAEEPSPTQRVVRGTGRTPPRLASSLETRASEPAKVPPKNEKGRLGVRMPHPEDGVGSGRASTGRARSGAPEEMFRKYYDKYLENYQGYVELAEGLYQKRDNGGITPGSFEEREWEERLRRVNDGIERTTVRLDILEEHNPELATDERISQRASVARRYLGIQQRDGSPPTLDLGQPSPSR